jgi:hypothetical protein
VSAYGCASTTSVAAASAMKPPTTPIATRCAVLSATGRTATAYFATSRPAHTPPTPAAMHSVGSAGIQCFSAPKIGVEPRKNGPIDAAADRPRSSAGARSGSALSLRRQRAIHRPMPVIAAPSVETGTVNSVVTSATCHGNRGAFQL